jgi:hypothetical protein
MFLLYNGSQKEKGFSVVSFSKKGRRDGSDGFLIVIVPRYINAVIRRGLTLCKTKKHSQILIYQHL